MSRRAQILQPYSPTWATAFLALKQQYLSLLPGLVLAVEHIGSTAIPGILAKPILDIDIVIEHPARLPEVVARLATVGYRHNGDQGISGREAFERQDESVPYTQPGRIWINHHLYVCAQNSNELARHVAFRDYLLVDEAARLAYEAIKLNIASRSKGDRKRYAAIKEVECRPFVEGILAQALQARNT